MFPQHVLSTTPILGTLLLPNKQPSEVVSNEWGGVNLNDPSQGLFLKVWTCILVGDDVVLSAPGSPTTVVFSRPNLSEVSLAFDQNMRPFIAFVQTGQSKFYWFDSLIQDFRFTDLPSGSTTPRCTLDDHRQAELSTSDIVLVYIHDGNLCLREQRDRFLIEYILYEDLNLTLQNPRIESICMNSVNRVQIFLKGNF